MVDQAVLATLDLQTIQRQGADLAGPAAGIAQHHIHGVEHGLDVVAGPVAVTAVAAEHVDVGIELGDDRFGDGLADLVLVLVDELDAQVGMAAEPGGQSGQHLIAAAEVQHRQEQPEQGGAVLVPVRPPGV